MAKINSNDRREFVCMCGVGLFISQLSQAASISCTPDDPTCSTVGKSDYQEKQLSKSGGISAGDLAQSPNAAMACSLFAASVGGNQLAPSSVSQKLENILKVESNYLSQRLGVRASVTWIDDSKSPNAYASSDGGVGLDGRIGMGVNLSDSLMKQYAPTLGEYSSMVVGMVLAHEFMHIQYFQKVKQGRAPYMRGKIPELLSDWFAGFHLAHRSWDHFVFTKGTQNIIGGVYQSMAQAFKMGDNNFTSPSHHGTNQERAQVFISGASFADQFRKKLLMTTGNSPYTFSPDEVFNLARGHLGF